MRYLTTKAFQRDLKDNHLNDEYVAAVLDDIFAGRALSLGAKLYKIRAIQKGRGKRSGFRNIFFWKQDELIIFCLLFGKNEQDDLTADEKKALRILSNEYDRLTRDEIEAAVHHKQFKEIYYD